ncbi:4948_t:CDS:1 [Ambispora gerdemannii]|uniref:4948_t:CDS:1 n=1 Tax=Ambispora gerdemannii TaxID=144530 RepID=A0A9N9GF91_9GLOM|nr:4948_t:CDS:1 [Ambispora gerdemannii]
MNSNTNKEIDNNHNLLRYSYSVDETATRLDELHQTEQQHYEPSDIWSNFVEGSDLPILNEENVLLDSERSFDSDIPTIEIEFASDPSTIEMPQVGQEDSSSVPR